MVIEHLDNVAEGPSLLKLYVPRVQWFLISQSNVQTVHGQPQAFGPFRAKQMLATSTLEYVRRGIHLSSGLDGRYIRLGGQMVEIRSSLNELFKFEWHNRKHNLQTGASRSVGRS